MYKLKVEAYDGKKFKKLFNRKYKKETSALKKFDDLMKLYENHQYKSIKILLFKKGDLIARERLINKSTSKKGH